MTNLPLFRLLLILGSPLPSLLGSLLTRRLKDADVIVQPLVRGFTVVGLRDALFHPLPQFLHPAGIAQFVRLGVCLDLRGALRSGGGRAQDPGGNGLVIAE